MRTRVIMGCWLGVGLVVMGLGMGRVTGAQVKAENAKPAAPPVSAASQTAVVGPLAGTRRLTFEGNKKFSAAQLVSGLRGNSSWMLASHPEAPREAFLKITRECLERGYHWSGYPLAKVSAPRVEGSPEHAVFVIEEGPRYIAGPVRVEGVKTMPTEEIIRFLTTKEDPGGSPPHHVDNPIFTNQSERTQLWEKGERAPLEDTGLQNAAGELESLLSGFGWMQAKVKLTAERDDTTHIATLVVKIEEEGPRAAIGNIEVVGASRDMPAQVMQFLGISQGQAMTPTLTTELEHKLWLTGRYRSAKVTTKPVSDQATQATLSIELEELPEAPALAAPLTPSQQTMLKCAAWLDEIKRTGRENLIFEAHVSSPGSGAGEIAAISDPRGWIVSFLPLGKQPGKFLLRYTAEDLSTLWLPQGGDEPRWLRGGSIYLPLQNFALSLRSSRSEDGTSDTTIRIGAGLKATVANDPLRFDLELSPSVFMLWAIEGGANWKSENGILSIRHVKDRHNSDYTLAVEEATGRIKECELRFSRAPHEDEVYLRLTVAPGRWEAANREIEEKSKGLPNAYDAKDAWPSWAGFMAEGFMDQWIGVEPGATAAQIATSVQTVRDFTRDFLVEPLSQLNSLFGGDGEVYVIPMTQQEAQQAASPTALYGTILTMFADTLMDDDSWLWLLTRELVYIGNGHTEYTDRVMQQIQKDPHLGPMGAFAVSRILASFRPADSLRFLELAQTKLSAKEFERDWKLLLDSPVGRRASFTAFLTRLQQGHMEELQLLETLLKYFDLQTKGLELEELGKLLHADADRPLAKVLQPVMDKWWNKTLGPDYKKTILDELQPKGPDGKPIPREGVAAVVNGRVISKLEFQDALTLATQTATINVSVSPSAAATKRQLSPREQQALDSLINRTLLVDLFYQMGGKVPPEVVDQRVNQTAQEDFNGDMEKFRAALARGGFTLERFHALTEKNLIVDAITRKLNEGLPPPTEADIAAALAELPPVRTVKLSTLTVADEATARALRGKIQGGEDFATLAKTQSKDTRASDGGAMDWQDINSLAPALAPSVIPLKPGQVSEPLQLGDSWLLIRLDQERTTAGEGLSAEQKKEAGMQRNIRLHHEKTLQDLRGKARIQIMVP